MNLEDCSNVATQHLVSVDDALFGNESDDGVVKLVPYGFHSDSDNSFEMPKRTRKQKKRVQVENDAWLRGQNKTRRQCGKSYYTRRKEGDVWNYTIMKEPRAIKSRCKCIEKDSTSTMKCARVTDAQRKQIFEMFWKMDWRQKKIYVDTLVHSTQPAQPRNRTNPNVSRRAQTLKYHLKLENQILRVCRTFFLNTLNIGRHAVLNWVKKPSDAYNNVTNIVNKDCSEDRTAMNTFFDTLPVMESHYCRAVTQKKYLLPEWRSNKMVYDFYSKDWCTTRNVRPLSLSLFHSIFESRNYALFAPKKDQCELCARYSVGSLSFEEYSLHQAKKEEARQEKHNDRTEELNVFTVDLQAVLMAPRS